MELRRFSGAATPLIIYCSLVKRTWRTTCARCCSTWPPDVDDGTRKEARPITWIMPKLYNVWHRLSRSSRRPFILHLTRLPPAPLLTCSLGRPHRRQFLIAKHPLLIYALPVGRLLILLLHRESVRWNVDVEIYQKHVGSITRRKWRLLSYVILSIFEE